jgi:hypothetical protein
MAIKYLTNLSLEGNEIQNVKLHPVGTAPSNPAAGSVYYNTSTSKLMMYSGSAWYSVNGDVETVSSGTVNQITVQGGTGATPTIAAVTAAVADGGTALATGDQIYDFVTAEIAGVVQSDTTYSVSVAAGAGNDADIVLTAGGSGSGTDLVTIEGTTSEITISENVATSTITVGLPDNVVIGNNLTVTGDLTVSGTTTTVNTETINLADNIITLNSNETGTPSENSGIEVERGTSTNVVLRWNESTDRWQFTNDGSTYYDIAVPSEYNDYEHPTFAGDDIDLDTTALTGATIISDLDFNVTTDTNGHVTDANATFSTRELTASDIGAQAAGTYNTIIGTDTDYTQAGVNIIKSLTLTDGVIEAFTTGDMQSSTTTQSGVVELATNAETAAGSDSTRAVTPAGLASVLSDVLLDSSNHNSYLIGNGTLTTLTVTHNWNTKLYVAQLVEEATGETVFAEVARPTVNTATVTFASAPSSNQYRLHLIKTAY